MATVVTPDKALIAALGPFKIEILQLTSVSNDDTVSSKLVRPIAAFMVPSVDATSTTQNQSATVSGQTITLRDPAKTSQTLIVIGF